jgi:hypothetical protein
MDVYAGRAKGDVRSGLILGEKTPTHLYYVPTLLEWFPQARIIHTFRDPRAIIVSKLKKVKRKGKEGPKQKLPRLPGWLLNPLVDPIEVLHMTKAWLDAAQLHSQYERSYPGRYHLVKFENLVGDPERHIRQICNFLEVPFESKMLEEVNIIGSSYISQRRGPDGFDRQATDRWRENINPLVKAWVSLSCRKYLRKFNYTPY